MTINRAEYDICQRRGHQNTGTAITVGWVTQYVCRWCGVSYTKETVEREINPPIDSAEENDD